MGILSYAANIVKNNQSNPENFEISKKNLLKHLKELKALESKLWGVTINHLSSGEEVVLEDTNHLIYYISSEKHDELSKILEMKEIEDFLSDIRNLKSDFVYLKKQIKEKDKLKNLISSFTIKLVDEKNYDRLEDIFLLEKQLYDVIERQDEELSNFMENISKIKVDMNSKKVDAFMDSLVNIRKILAGHMDHHDLWEEERMGFSNTSNILHSLIKIVQEK